MVVDKPTDKNLATIFSLAACDANRNSSVVPPIELMDDDDPNDLLERLAIKLSPKDDKLARLKAKKKDKPFWDYLWIIAIRQSLDRINEIIQDLQERMEELLEKMAKAEEELEELDRQHEILEEELAYFQENGLFDCDENGQLKNPEAEAILQAWEQETEQKIDRTNPASYRAILRVLVEIDQGRAILQYGLRKDASEYEHRKQQLEEAIEIRDGLQSSDKAINRNALADFEQFMDGYDPEFTYGPQMQNDMALESDPLFEEGLEELPDSLAGEFSFGFPSIKEEFRQSASVEETNETKEQKATSGQALHPTNPPKL